MKTMKWLIRREFWEHRGALLWAPLIVGGLMSFFAFINLGLGASVTGIHQSFTFNGTTLDATMLMKLSPEQIATLAKIMSTAYMGISAPLLISYCLNALYDERRDRSILFWKSLPVSDGMTVLSKVAVAVVLAPLMTVAIATVTATLILLMSAIALATMGVNVFGIILSSPSFYLAPLELAGLVPVYMMWALPTVGWLLMVSSWARSKVILWAIGVPVLTILLIIWAEKMFHVEIGGSLFAEHIAGRALLGVIPGWWVIFDGIDISQIFGPDHLGIDLTALFTQSWSSMKGLNMWVGVVAGAAMIYAAIRMRRWREEG
jgi:ABC-2 type transport system permease protein